MELNLWFVSGSIVEFGIHCTQFLLCRDTTNVYMHYEIVQKYICKVIPHTRSIGSSRSISSKSYKREGTVSIETTFFLSQRRQVWQQESRARYTQYFWAPEDEPPTLFNIQYDFYAYTMIQACSLYGMYDAVAPWEIFSNMLLLYRMRLPGEISFHPVDKLFEAIVLSRIRRFCFPCAKKARPPYTCFDFTISEQTKLQTANRVVQTSHETFFQILVLQLSWLYKSIDEVKLQR